MTFAGTQGVLSYPFGNVSTNEELVDDVPQSLGNNLAAADAMDAASTAESVQRADVTCARSALLQHGLEYFDAGLDEVRSFFGEHHRALQFIHVPDHAHGAVDSADLAEIRVRLFAVEPAYLVKEVRVERREGSDASDLKFGINPGRSDRAEVARSAAEDEPRCRTNLIIGIPVRDERRRLEQSRQVLSQRGWVHADEPLFQLLQNFIRIISIAVEVVVSPREAILDPVLEWWWRERAHSGSLLAAFGRGLGATRLQGVQG